MTERVFALLTVEAEYWNTGTPGGRATACALLYQLLRDQVRTGAFLTLYDNSPFRDVGQTTVLNDPVHRGP